MREGKSGVLGASSAIGRFQETVLDGCRNEIGHAETGNAGNRHGVAGRPRSACTEGRGVANEKVVTPDWQMNLAPFSTTPKNVGQPDCRHRHRPINPRVACQSATPGLACDVHPSGCPRTSYCSATRCRGTVCPYRTRVCRTRASFRLRTDGHGRQYCSTGRPVAANRLW